MTRPLPPKASLRFLQKEAKDLVKAHKDGDAAVCDLLKALPKLARASDDDVLAAEVSLQEAQHALALSYGFKGWKELKRHVDLQAKGRQKAAFKFGKFIDISFIAKDVAATASFYEKVGLKKFPVEEPKVFALGDKELAIHGRLPADFPLPKPNTVYVSVWVDDLASLCKHLDDQGIDYWGSKDSHLGEKSIHLTDPDGNHIEAHQQKR